VTGRMPEAAFVGTSAAIVPMTPAEFGRLIHTGSAEMRGVEAEMGRDTVLSGRPMAILPTPATATEAAMPIYDFSAFLSSGEERRLADYRGKVLMVVNVASQCGFTPQYEGLQRLHQRFGARGFEVLAFPCDQFGHQEPASDAEISAFCDRTYGVTFPLFAKIEVNGKNAHPLYVWLAQEKRGWLGGSIKWNFTKFLVDRAGAVRARFAPVTKPDSIARRVAALL
jgi:glutathione peroxidase